MKLNQGQLVKLIRGMRNAYERGENAMTFAKELLKGYDAEDRNHRLATLIAYDLQAGTYVKSTREHPAQKERWCRSIAELIVPELPRGGSVLELGVGEATTLAGVLRELGVRVEAYGFDISWSRIQAAKEWLCEQSQVADLFVGDLLNIPLADRSIDVVYSSHSLEPNGGREGEAIAECLRVARRAVVLVEPLYELASPEAQSRMREHGYVRGLKEAAVRLGAEVIDYRLLENVTNPLNPSGVLALRKSHAHSVDALTSNGPELPWRCPLSGTVLRRTKDGFFSPEIGVAYPILAGVPLLRVEHAVVASRFCRGRY